MTKEIVEKLRKEYLAISERDGTSYKEEWYLSESKDPDYVWACSSFEAALARVNFWNADCQYRYEEEGEELRHFVIQNKNGVASKKELAEEFLKLMKKRHCFCETYSQEIKGNGLFTINLKQLSLTIEYENPNRHGCYVCLMDDNQILLQESDDHIASLLLKAKKAFEDALNKGE